MKGIIIHDSKFIGSELSSKVTVHKSLRKYFKSFIFRSNYSSRIIANPSILNIPLLSTVLPLAWLTGTDIYVEELDKTYKDTMGALKLVFKRWYPEAPFNTNIFCDRLVENKIECKNPDEHTALLFSGGVDSTYSLIKNIHLKPQLIMIGGLEGSAPYLVFWEKVRKIYSKFAERQGVTFHYVESNARNILNENRITHKFHKPLRDGELWERISLPLVLLGLTAPLSIGRFDGLLIASSCHPTYPYHKHPYASQPCTDEKIAWADLHVKHDGYVKRIGKILMIRKYLRNNKLTLRVCLSQHKKLNCSVCLKCLRTISALAFAGINPNECGFEVNRSTFILMKSLIERKKLDEFSIETNWKDLQNMTPNKIENDLYGSKAFFEWFKKCNLNLAQERLDVYKRIYYKLPYHIARALDVIIYGAMGVGIHK